MFWTESAEKSSRRGLWWRARAPTYAPLAKSRETVTRTVCSSAPYRPVGGFRKVHRHQLALQSPEESRYPGGLGGRRSRALFVVVVVVWSSFSYWSYIRLALVIASFSVAFGIVALSRPSTVNHPEILNGRRSAITSGLYQRTPDGCAPKDRDYRRAIAQVVGGVGVPVDDHNPARHHGEKEKGRHPDSPGHDATSMPSARRSSGLRGWRSRTHGATGRGRADVGLVELKQDHRDVVVPSRRFRGAHETLDSELQSCGRTREACQRVRVELVRKTVAAEQIRSPPMA